MRHCKAIGCNKSLEGSDSDYCDYCQNKTSQNDSNESLSLKYPAYYKDVSDLTEIDVYETHNLFQMEDPSGCLQHASKKLLLSGARTGNKPKYKDVKEARDTLTRWLQIHARQEQNG